MDLINILDILSLSHKILKNKLLVLVLRLSLIRMDWLVFRSVIWFKNGFRRLKCRKRRKKRRNRRRRRRRSRRIRKMLVNLVKMHNLRRWMSNNTR